MRQMNASIRRLAVVATTLSLALAACTSPGGGASATPAGSSGTPASAPATGGTVNIAINPWVGYEANAAVVAYILEKELGYTVVKKDLKEDVSWQGFETGEVDVIIENWGHPDLEKKYIDEDKVAQIAGETGNIGIIGWYVPKWMVDEHPDITDCKNLNKYADLFKTSESGDQGQFLGSDPSYVQYDEALIDEPRPQLQGHLLGRRGRDDHGLPAGRHRQEAAHRLLLGSAVAARPDRARPGQAAGVHGRLRRRPGEGRLRLPGDALNKIVSTKFATEGGEGLRARQELHLDQRGPEPVADYITNQGMSAAGRGREVDRGQRGQVEGVDAPVGMPA